jgi:hypothetical protein
MGGPLATDYTDKGGLEKGNFERRTKSGRRTGQKKCDQKRNQNTRYVIVLMFIHRRVGANWL